MKLRFEILKTRRFSAGINEFLFFPSESYYAACLYFVPWQTAYSLIAQYLLMEKVQDISQSVY